MKIARPVRNLGGGRRIIDVVCGFKLRFQKGVVVQTGKLLADAPSDGTKERLRLIECLPLMAIAERGVERPAEAFVQIRQDDAERLKRSFGCPVMVGAVELRFGREIVFGEFLDKRQYFHTVGAQCVSHVCGVACACIFDAGRKIRISVDFLGRGLQIEKRNVGIGKRIAQVGNGTRIRCGIGGKRVVMEEILAVADEISDTGILINGCAEQLLRLAVEP